MKRIVCLCVILLCSISFAFAQGGSGRTNTRARAKKVVSPFIEAEKAWMPFWKDLQEIAKNRDLQGLYEIMSEDFSYKQVSKSSATF